MTLLRPHIELMYRMAYRWTLCEQDAEDIVQDVLVRLANKVQEMEQVEQLRPWLIKCVYRRYVDLYRSQKSSPIANMSSLPSASNEEDDSAMLDEDRLGTSITDSHDYFAQYIDQEALQKAINQIDSNQRDVILLHDVEGYSASEVAAILDEQIGTIKSRLHRARAKLKIFLQAGTY